MPKIIKVSSTIPTKFKTTIRASHMRTPIIFLNDNFTFRTLMRSFRCNVALVLNLFLRIALLAFMPFLLAFEAEELLTGRTKSFRFSFTPFYDGLAARERAEFLIFTLLYLEVILESQQFIICLLLTPLLNFQIAYFFPTLILWTN